MATSPRRRRSTSATAAPWTAISCRRAWPSPKARTSVAVWTCSARVRSRGSRRSSSGPRPSRRRRRRRSRSQPHRSRSRPRASSSAGGMALSDLFSRRRKEDHDGADSGAVDSPAHPTKALAKFLNSLGTRPQPLLLDLGPVIGSNVTFFGEQVGCKILVEDLFKDIDRHVREGKIDQLPAFFEKRFPQEAGVVDGILCWDIFDYLERAAAAPLTRQLTRLLRPDGVMLAFFSTADPRSSVRPTYTRHVIVDRDTLQYRPYAAARGKQRPLLNRDIQRLFEPLRITEQFLLKTNLREVLYRKAAAAAPAAPTSPQAEP